MKVVMSTGDNESCEGRADVALGMRKGQRWVKSGFKSID
jgi:hypothetical protein